MLQQRAAGLGRGHALTSAHQQRRAERLLHVADARGGGGQREMRAFGAVRDAAGFDHVAKQAEIGEVEAHGRLRFAGRFAFEFDEGKLREKPIVAPESLSIIFVV